MNIPEIEAFLCAIARRPQTLTRDDVNSSLLQNKSVAIASNNDEQAKHLWCLRTTLVIQNGYIDAFGLLKQGEFYEAWCKFEIAENNLHFLERHGKHLFDRFGLHFIADHVRNWQSIYPYRVFFSPEFLEKKKVCSICGKIVVPRNRCGHIKGQIYRGEMCSHIIEDAQFLGVGMVECPVQKYSVAFLTDPATGKRVDHYRYDGVRYAIGALQDAFDAWGVTKTIRVQPHSKFSEGRNDPCPCGSKKKYKKCCLMKDGVACPHLEFRFAVPPPRGFETDRFMRAN